ncbi:response regulator [Anaerocolumna sp. AGMB13025]|uniref:response regulator transcription factor n=1 Tax=Anaerocolumna sp. AGMB13025 TaxID=3039116 RepID=UPI00241CA337|nr:response regulator [Anaerocolumna sp. AGMB13025]WFR58042.1 response regulator [Anaerocolumna sp. AGMB13025]
MRVIIVDDENVFRDYIKSMEIWQKGEYKLAGEAKSSKEALELLRSSKVDIVLMDVCMPNENGVYLSTQIAHEFPKVAMIAISSYDNYDYVRDILKNGAFDYILKNRLTEENLETALNNITTDKKQISQVQKKNQDRNTLKAWIEKGERLTLQWERKRKMYLIGTLSKLEDMEETIKTNYIKGILTILEENDATDKELVASYFHNGYFVVMICYTDFTSEAELLQQTEMIKIRALNNIQRIFHISLKIQVCPQMSSEHALLSYIRHCFHGPETPGDKVSNLTLSLNQRKCLYIALESDNIEIAATYIEQIYGDIKEQEYGKIMMTTAELFDILEKACMDVNINLDFIPKNEELYEYVKRKDKENLVSSMIGLYRNALKEIAEHKITYSEKVKAAINYMNHNFEKIVGMSEVSDAIGVSGSYLSRIFHVETGKTLINYLNEIRIEKAKSYLQLNKIPLKQVVTLCGFKNYSYFMNVFKEYTGKTPKDYQNGIVQNSKQ